MANLIDGADVAAWLGLDATQDNADRYANVAAVASLWVDKYCVIPVDTTVLVLATTMLAARLAKRAATPEGIGGITDGGVFYVSRTDPDANMLLAPYLKWDGFA